MSPPVTIFYGDDEKIIFEVPSRRTDEKYFVTWDFDDGWLCDCDGCLKGGHLCRHILACIGYVKFMQMAILDDPRAVFTADEGGLIGTN